jgi:hypothetical protein
MLENADESILMRTSTVPTLKDAAEGDVHIQEDDDEVES